MSKVLIVGGGAAGMFASIFAAKNGNEVHVFEKNEKLGKKLFITGKGRCNVTNACDVEELFQNMVSNEKFMYSSFYGFTNQDVMDFFENAGLRLKTERGNRVFPQSDHSSDVIRTLELEMKRNGVHIHLYSNVEKVVAEDGRFSYLVMADGSKEEGDACIIATGGVSYQTTGSTGDGYRFAEAMGHKITEPAPSLVPMNVREEYIPALMGLSLRNVQAMVYDGKKELYSDFGEMLFTHFGVSGPLIISASAYVGKILQKKHELKLVIDLKPALSEEQLDARVLREFDTNHNKQFKNAVTGLFPAKLLPVMIHLSGTVGKGSCRSWGGFNLFAALERCSDLLLDFGGHELAAGFTIDVANIPAFRQRMNQLVREYQGGGAPEVCLEIDAALTCPSRVTLTEVEALGMLEPYGAGNARPLFCLMGATLERLQSVGQNRHLKLRLSKGSSQFDGIFFSVSPDTCPVAAGSRVDAAFYLQINEFRGNRTVQLQMVDIRPSLTVSTREDECLHLLERCLRGDRLLPKEAVHLLPSRSQCVQLWRALEHTVPPEGLTACYLPLLRELSARLEGADPFLRTAFCLEVFRERQLLTLRQEGDTISITLTGQGKHVRLEESGYLQGLHEVMQPKRGGDHHD